MWRGKNKVKYIFRNNRVAYDILRFFYTFFVHPERLQKKKIKNADKIVYIIRPDSEDCVEGLMSLFIRTMVKIDYARRMGYIPYVDYLHYKTQYYNGKDNVWEYYFSQPFSIETSGIQKGRNVILSGVTIRNPGDKTLFRDNIFYDRENCRKCYNLIWRNIDLSKDVKMLVQREMTFIDIEKCIGVYIRGTDYILLKPTGEHVQPSIIQLCEKVEEFIQKYEGTSVFLVTEDQKYYDEMRSRFGNKILTVTFDSFINNYEGKSFLSKSGVLNPDKKKRGMDYLVKIILLSRCRYFVGAITMGSIAAYAMNGGKYEDEYVFDLGRYPWF